MPRRISEMESRRRRYRQFTQSAWVGTTRQRDALRRITGIPTISIGSQANLTPFEYGTYLLETNYTDYHNDSAVLRWIAGGPKAHLSFKRWWKVTPLALP